MDRGRPGGVCLRRRAGGPHRLARLRGGLRRDLRHGRAARARSLASPALHARLPDGHTDRRAGARLQEEAPRRPAGPRVQILGGDQGHGQDHSGRVRSRGCKVGGAERRGCDRRRGVRRRRAAAEAIAPRRPPRRGGGGHRVVEAHGAARQVHPHEGGGGRAGGAVKVQRCAPRAQRDPRRGGGREGRRQVGLVLVVAQARGRMAGR
mmetsp:Transcript_23588/g.67592  ORF Transcript_23588/g.67592 Transcript_23588/m.67592 type:complete len:207 (+) Transcript_23588:425-1045(+)